MNMSKIIVYSGFGLIVLFLVLICVAIANADTKSHKNSTGAVISYSNPNIYVSGNIISGSLIESGDKRFLNIRIQPSHTFTLYTEEVLLCDAQNTLDKFVGKSNPVVLTYEKIARDSVQQIGCHNLIGVSEVKIEKEIK
jgi:CRISPR/Cas system CMR-associated protein Cmr5 small subunit